MKLDLNKLDQSELNSEVLVVGAGAVGIILAVALARAGLDVVLLESGGERVEQSAQELNTSSVEGRPHLGVHEGRARLLGGTTTLWGGQLVRFDDVDFEERSWVPHSGWPLSLSDLHPFYDQVADLLGLDKRRSQDAQVWSALGLAKASIGAEHEIILTRWLRDTNFARYFKSDIDTRPNLRVVLHATATAIHSTPTSDRVTAVTACSVDGRSASISAKQVVIACGTVEASRLLLAAARSDPSLPWARNPWIGKCFQDHLAFHGARVYPTSLEAFGDMFDNIYIDGYKYNPKIRLASQVQRQQNLLNVSGVFIFESSLSEHISHLKLFLRALRHGVMPQKMHELPRHLFALSRLWWPLVRRYVKDRRAFNLSDRGIQLWLHCEQMPVANSRIILSDNDRDVFNVPRVRLDWQVDGREVETMAAFAEKLAAQLSEAGLARLVIDEDLVARDPSVLARCIDTNHQCGGLRMAKHQEDGVVSPELRVFGTENLYVAGAAVFPTSSFANPTFTAMALALRLAAHLTSPEARQASHG